MLRWQRKCSAAVSRSADNKLKPACKPTNQQTTAESACLQTDDVSSAAWLSQAGSRYKEEWKAGIVYSWLLYSTSVECAPPPCSSVWCQSGVAVQPAAWQCCCWCVAGLQARCRVCHTRLCTCFCCVESDPSTLLRPWPLAVESRWHVNLVIIHHGILEQCSLFLPLQWGAGSMALMLWLDW
jgi:hypothetical protein